MSGAVYYPTLRAKARGVAHDLSLVRRVSDLGASAGNPHGDRRHLSDRTLFHKDWDHLALPLDSGRVVEPYEYYDERSEE